MNWTDLIDNAPDRENPERPWSVGHTGEQVRNRFGMDEALDVIEGLGAEAILVVNLRDALVGLRTVEEAAFHAAGLVAYATAEVGADLPEGMPDYPAIRALNGRAEPWDVRYLQIGNEWWLYREDGNRLLPQNGPVDPEVKALLFETLDATIAAIRAVDPDIEIILDGMTSDVTDEIRGRVRRPRRLPRSPPVPPVEARYHRAGQRLRRRDRRDVRPLRVDVGPRQPRRDVVRLGGPAPGGRGRPRPPAGPRAEPDPHYRLPGRHDRVELERLVRRRRRRPRRRAGDAPRPRPRLDELPLRDDAARRRPRARHAVDARRVELADRRGRLPRTGRCLPPALARLDPAPQRPPRERARGRHLRRAPDLRPAVQDGERDPAQAGRRPRRPRRHADGRHRLRPPYPPAL